MDFPDSNYLAKTLTIVTGPDMVNLTYYNFFAPKENIVQVRISLPIITTINIWNSIINI